MLQNETVRDAPVPPGEGQTDYLWRLIGRWHAKRGKSDLEGRVAVSGHLLPAGGSSGFGPEATRRRARGQLDKELAGSGRGHDSGAITTLRVGSTALGRLAWVE